MKILDCPQGSEEWLQARLGKATASRIADVTAKTKSGPSASRKNYAAQLIAERLTGACQDSYKNAAMQWGTEKEPEAREFYEMLTGNDVRQVGMVLHPEIEMSLASPDGLIGDDGLVEIKCPNTATHIETLLSEKIDKKYLQQMQWQMACTGRKWCDFVSYDPRLDITKQIWIFRVERDDKMIKELEKEVTLFLAEIAETIDKLNRKFGQQSEAAA